jgi:hypothetical protein
MFGLMEGFPPGYILLALAIGLIVVLFSPLSVFLTNYVSNPFFVTAEILPTPTDLLSRFAITAIISFVVGIPLSFLVDPFVTIDGVNAMLTGFLINRSNKRQLYLLKIRESIVKKLDGKLIIKDHKNLEKYKFAVWLKDTGYLQPYNYLVLKNSVINGILVGSELAVFFNMAFFPLLREKILPFFLISFLMFLAIYFFNKFYWQDAVNYEIRDIYQAFTRGNQESMAECALL